MAENCYNYCKVMDNQQPTSPYDANQAQAIEPGRGQAIPPPPPSGPTLSQPTASSSSLGAQQPIAVAPDEAEMDKAWIDRAVVLLDKTREDPFLQSQEIAKLRAQYMQSRFDKQIKIAQEQK
jgi:hypothetical protein